MDGGVYLTESKESREAVRNKTNHAIFSPSQSVRHFVMMSSIKVLSSA